MTILDLCKNKFSELLKATTVRCNARHDVWFSNSWEIKNNNLVSQVFYKIEFSPRNVG